MANKNLNLDRLNPNYLFPEIQKRLSAYLTHSPQADLINLGIGDTTEPIPDTICDAMALKAKQLSTPLGYSGYGPTQGNSLLRELIAKRFYQNQISKEEIFVSDGAKCDTGRLLHIFDHDLIVAVQDPTYPVYVDTLILSGKTKKLIYLECHPKNAFFPSLEGIDTVDLIYFCSPNNPTGAAATSEQLETLVAFARKKRAIILFDAAYSTFIQDPLLPTTIYAIDGAKDVAVEIHSFSKFAGFTGVRLGWTVVPKSLQFRDGSKVSAAVERVLATFFNGASSLAESGGIAALNKINDLMTTRELYMENAKLLKETFESLGLNAYGGSNAPYVWVDFSPKKSWEMFDELLVNTEIVSVPGVGFGPSGEGFLRFSAFATRQSILEALARMSCYLAVENISGKVLQ